MEKKLTLQSWWRSALLGAVLAGGAGICLAVDPIVVNTFDSASELSSWSELTAKGTVEYCPVDGGCLKVTLPVASGGVEVQPQVALGAKSFNSAQYWSVSFDIKVDPTSGLSSDGTTFGHWQVVARNASWSWNGLNWSVLDTSYTNGWRHVEVGFVQPYDTVDYIVIQVQGGPYAGDLIYYIDNIKISPLPYSIIVNAFTNASEVGAYSAWGVTGSGVSWTNNPDAGGATPAGSMQIFGNYDGSNPNWVEATCQRDFSFDPSRFTYFDLDAYFDPGTATSYEGMSVFLRQNHAPWNWIWIATHNFSAADIGKWTHLSIPLAPSGETNAAGFVVQTGGNGLATPMSVYVDNIRIWTPQVPPTLSKPVRGGAGGATVAMDQTGNQWEREALATPAGNTYYTWYNVGQTYSFTITNFPDAAAHPGFEAHMYIVNEDTIPGTNPGWNETYAACDWNAADILQARIQNISSGGVDFAIRYKTNLPNANINTTAMSVHSATAIGTWTITFADNTNITVTGPSGISTNFNIPTEVADRFNCAVSFLQFGAFKNDGANSGANDGASLTFSRVQMLTGGYAFDDNFSGPGLTANNAWRTTSASAVTWSPDGVGWWLTWSLPDDGFNPVVSGSVTGPYTDAGVTYKYTKGATRIGAVPAANIPAGDAVFFRLVKTQ